MAKGNSPLRAQKEAKGKLQKVKIVFVKSTHSSSFTSSLEGALLLSLRTHGRSFKLPWVAGFQGHGPSEAENPGKYEELLEKHVLNVLTSSDQQPIVEKEQEDSQDQTRDSPEAHQPEAASHRNPSQASEVQ